jgi:hypothetical protein
MAVIMGRTYRDRRRHRRGRECADKASGSSRFANNACVSLPRPRDRELAVRTQLGLDIAVGSAARLVLAVVTSYRASDAGDMAAWATAMRHHPLAEFYARARRPDHLPGDLWLLKAIQFGYSFAGGRDFGSAVFEFLTNLVPIGADVLVGVLLFRIALTWGSEQAAARTARWYLLNPAVIVLAGAWGQWDAVSMLLILAGLLLVLRGTTTAWLGAVPLMTWAVLTKPQLVVPAAGIMVWFALRHRAQRRVGGTTPVKQILIGATAAVSLAAICAVLVLQPFRVGLAWIPAGGSSLADRLQYAAELHPFTTVGAANIWLIVDRRVIGPADDVHRWAGLSALNIGVGLLVVLWCAILVAMWRARGLAWRPEPMLWCVGTAVFAMCLVLTRVHERYYYPGLVLLLLWASSRGFDRASGLWFRSFSVLFVIDLLVPMGWNDHDQRSLQDPVVLVFVGLAHVLLFAALMAIGPRVGVDCQLTVGAPSAAPAARRTAPD